MKTYEQIRKEMMAHKEWLSETASNCQHAKEHEFVSIPTFLPKCELTNDAVDMKIVQKLGW